MTWFPGDGGGISCRWQSRKGGGGDIENLLQQKTFKTTKTLNDSRVTLLAHRGVSVAQWLKRRSAVSEGLRFDSSWGLRIFSLSHVRDKTNKNLSLHFDFFPVSQNKQVIFILIISNSYCSFGQDSWILASFLFLRFSELWLVTVHTKKF